MILDSCRNRNDRLGKLEWIIAGATADAALYLDWESWRKDWRLNPFWTFGVIGYEVRRVLEPKLNSSLLRNASLLNLPQVCLFRPDWVAMLHRGSREMTVYAEDDPEKLLNELTRISLTDSQATRLPRFDPLFPFTEYSAAFREARERLRDGDIYEMNLTRAYAGRSDRPLCPVSLFEQLCQRSPVPMAACMVTEAGCLVSASPERLFRIDSGGLLTTQPIKGTLPRGGFPCSDLMRWPKLRENAKLRAENVMIADLARNDLNKVCVPGSVVATSLFQTQAYRRLLHSVTTVQGQLAKGFDSVAALEAVLPAGSMTGAPKVRAMQLIDELEPCEREWYAGNAGWLAPDGTGDWNVVIRSLLLDSERKRAAFHVGGAVTWDSEVVSEWEEGLLKASQFVGQQLLG